MPRFVVLQHDHPFLHWDFMLETATALRTWRLDGPPAANTSRASLSLPDHRLAYLDYEGPVSGGRGIVHRVLAGEYQLIDESDKGIHVRLTTPDGQVLSVSIAPAAGEGLATIEG